MYDVRFISEPLDWSNALYADTTTTFIPRLGDNIKSSLLGEDKEYNVLKVTIHYFDDMSDIDYIEVKIEEITK